MHITNVVGLGDTGHVAELGDWVLVDASAEKPLFDQLRIQIIDGIRQGRLAPGTRLPTVRELAGKVGLAVNTVARAYRELETAGSIGGPRAVRHIRRTCGSGRCRDGRCRALVRRGHPCAGDRQDRRPALSGYRIRLIGSADHPVRLPCQRSTSSATAAATLFSASGRGGEFVGAGQPAQRRIAMQVQPGRGAGTRCAAR